MKKLFLICLMTSILYSCKKDSLAVPDFSIAAKANNNPIVFATSALAYADSFSGAYRLRIFGNVGVSSDINHITLTIINSNPIGLGTYSGTASTQSPLGASIDYISDNSSIIYQSKLFPSNQYADNSVITITSIDSLTVRGTFSGTVYFPWYSISPITFTNGAFNEKLKKVP